MVIAKLGGTVQSNDLLGISYPVRLAMSKTLDTNLNNFIDVSLFSFFTNDKDTRKKGTIALGFLW